MPRKKPENRSSGFPAIAPLHPHWVWRVLLVLAGFAAYFGSAILVGTALVRYVGVPCNEPRRFRKLTFIPYFSAVLLAVAGGLLNPVGFQLVWQAALPGSAGADSGLLWMRFYIPNGTIPERGSESIVSSYVWITAAAIFSLLFFRVEPRDQAAR